MTPFEQALEAAKEKRLQVPEVFYEGKKVEYFKYQLIGHKYWLTVMSRGLKMRGVKLKDIKEYYGLKGRTAGDCLPQFLEIMKAHM